MCTGKVLAEAAVPCCAERGSTGGTGNRTTALSSLSGPQPFLLDLRNVHSMLASKAQLNQAVQQEGETVYTCIRHACFKSAAQPGGAAGRRTRMLPQA